MSWKTSGKLLSGPPTGSNTNKLDPRFKPNLGGLNAFQREQQLVGRYGGREAPAEQRRSEWDVLKENHRDGEEPSDVSWEERLARAYESKLFKEFALIDLKHYKSRRLALRWRTAEEVVDGLGEETCGSLRCKHHTPLPATPRNNRSMWEDASTPGPSISEVGSSRHHGIDRRKGRKRMPALRAFELPFVYEEAGQRKEALVKVRLCAKCQAKLTWKPGKEDPASEEDDERRSGKKARESKKDEQDLAQAERSDRSRHEEKAPRRSLRRADTSDDDLDPSSSRKASRDPNSASSHRPPRSRSCSPSRHRGVSPRHESGRNII